MFYWIIINMQKSESHSDFSQNKHSLVTNHLDQEIEEKLCNPSCFLVHYSPSNSNHYRDMSHHWLVCCFGTFYDWNFYDWKLCLICVDEIDSYFKVSQCMPILIAWKYHKLFIHSKGDGPLGCFQLFYYE